MQRLGLVVVAVIVVLAQGLVGPAVPDLRVCASPACAASERPAPPCCPGCTPTAQPAPAPAPEPSDDCQCDKIPVREALVPLLSIIPATKILADLPRAPSIICPRPASHHGLAGPHPRHRVPCHRHLVFLRSVVLTC